VSFVHDLYSPRYQARPVVEVSREQAYAPPVMAEGMAFEADEEERTFVARAAAAPRAAGYAPPPMPAPMSAPARQAAMRRSMPVQTRVEQVGDLFEYAIARPVDVGRNQSALVPILSATFSGKKVAVYNREIRDKNPMSAILFENTTGMTLEAGPLTVLEGERYLGESMLSTMKAGEKRLVPFSVELGCLVHVKDKGDLRAVHHAKISNGLLRLLRYNVRRTIYAVQSKLEQPLDLFIEHRFLVGWELVETQAPVETTESAYRFRVTLEPGQKLELVISERGQAHEELSLADINRERVGLLLKNRQIDQATIAALQGVIQLNERVTDLDRQAAEREREIQEITQMQQRLRENLQALGQGQDERRLRERYIAELSQQEDRLRELFSELSSIRNERALAQTALATEIGSLEFQTAL
jgi:hypothetical protein